MKPQFKIAQGILSIVITLSLVFANIQIAAADRQPPPGVNQQKASAPDPIRRDYHAETGKLTFLGASQSAPITVEGLQAQSLTSQARAMALLEPFAQEFGLQTTSQELAQESFTEVDGREVTHYQQLYNGVPVMGGELVVNATSTGELLSINGEVSPGLSLDVQPALSAEEARAAALAMAAETYQLSVSDFEAGAPELTIYDSRLLKPDGNPPSLVWRMDVRALDGSPVNELVLVDAQDGHISLHFNQIDTTWASTGDRNLPQPRAQDIFPQAIPAPVVQTYTMNNSSNAALLPGSFLCNQNQASCTGGANLDADYAHTYALGTFNFYFTNHQRNSIDNAGLAIISSVDFGVNFQNAFWSGAQMVYGDGFSSADDVVGHELTHGVTDYESALVYYYQSGAINESLSDVWGELYDQSNGLGNDTAGVKWLMGEDVPGGGAIRSMSNPPSYGDPDSMLSPYYYVGTDDNGGVHWNSGVNNKAVYLMVDGGTFNGKTVTALGAAKTLDIYYEAQTNLLTPMSDYADLYNILYQACLNRVGFDGIIAADCQEVRDATDAVMMNVNHSNPYPSTPANGNFESGYGVGWEEYSAQGYNLVTYEPSLPPHSGNYFAWLGGVDNETSVISQVVDLPKYAKLELWYYIGSADSCGYDFGGIFISGELVNKMDLCASANTYGWRSLVLDLNAYGGHEVLLEIYAETDTINNSNLFIDDVYVYDAVFSDVLPGNSSKSYIEAVYFSGITGGCKLEPLMYCPNNYVNRAQMAVFLLRSKHTSAYVPPAASGIFGDVPASNGFAPWIEQLYTEGITGGCTTSPLNYCPGNSVTRAQMAIFLLRAKYGSSYTPPDATGIFADVPASSWTAPWIEQLYKEGVTGGCTTVPFNYCPSKPVTRAQMAIFLVRAFNLPMP